MSYTPPNRVPRTTTKRRAERRKRNREIGRYIFAYGLVAILVLGTVSTVFIAPVGAPITTVPTVPPAPTTNNAFQQLITLGDQALLRGDTLTAYGFYSAYIAENPNDTQVRSKLDGAINGLPAAADKAVAAGQWLTATNTLEAYAREKSTDAQAQLKLAETILVSPQPDYVKAAAALERATKIPNSPVVAQAQALLTKHQPAIQTAVAASPTITGTISLTSTAPISPTTVITP